MAMVQRNTTHPGGGRADFSRIDATSEEKLARQQAEDDAQAALDVASYIRNLRKSLVMTQKEFSSRINVPLATLRNWEQGKRHPAGPARALLKILVRNPEAMTFLE